MYIYFIADTIWQFVLYLCKYNFSRIVLRWEKTRVNCNKKAKEIHYAYMVSKAPEFILKADSAFVLVSAAVPELFPPMNTNAPRPPGAPLVSWARHICHRAVALRPPGVSVSLVKRQTNSVRRRSPPLLHSPAGYYANRPLPRSPTAEAIGDCLLTGVCLRWSKVDCAANKWSTWSTLAGHQKMWLINWTVVAGCRSDTNEQQMYVGDERLVLSELWLYDACYIRGIQGNTDPLNL